MDLGISIERGRGKASYLQIYEQVAMQIHSGKLPGGSRLPTEKEMAETLGLSRNTVSSAYRRLEQEGLIEATPGRGTFVMGHATAPPVLGHTERIHRLFDLALEEALTIGLDLETYANLFRRHLRRYRERLRRTQLCFIECNHEQLASIAGAIRDNLGIETVSILLDDLRAGRKDVLKTLRDADLVLTSGYHAAEVVGLVANRRVDVVALQPKLDSLIQIAHLPETARVALVCRSERFAEDIRATLRDARINLPNLEVIRIGNEAELREQLREADAVIVSPSARPEVERLVSPNTQVIEFIHLPHEGSLDLIRTLVVDTERRASSDGAAPTKKREPGH
mgnify:CR=1 FL=1